MLRSATAALCAASLLPLHLVAQSANTASDSAGAWKRGAVCYEIFVRSFYDSDADGVGDLNGLIQKLDYVNDGDPKTNRDLGARCIWLMPIAESPSYHGYDVSDYYKVDREYGTNEDFKRLVAEAHRRGIKVLIDMVLNHSSSEHPYFQQALRDTASPYREWYRFAPRHPGDRNPWGGDNWHRSSVRDEYFYGLFWSGMPDLNYQSPAVREEAKKVARFWLEEMGADGFRLDAIPFLVEDGGRVQHAPGTHAYLREYAAFVRGVSPKSFTIGEVWDSTGAMLPYYPDQLDAHFAFEASDAILGAVRSGSAAKLFAPYLRLQAALPPERWSPFLRNHDQTRTLTELGGDVARARMAATLLLTLPGLPFVYYGEEIGMTGNKPDERLRTPMHWSREAGIGFTKGTVWQKLHPDSLIANVEAQDANPRSLLNVYRRLIHLRAENSALGSGELVPLAASTDAVAAYLRRDSGRTVLVIVNLGRTPLSNVTLASDPRALAAGRYSTRPLLGGPVLAPLSVTADGRIQGYVPLRSVGAMASYLVELVPAR
jgi:alpha-amylase